MSIVGRCAKCGKTYKVKDEMAGRRLKCKECGTVVTVPANTPAAPEDYPDGAIAKDVLLSKGTFEAYFYKGAHPKLSLERVAEIFSNFLLEGERVVAVSSLDDERLRTLASKPKYAECFAFCNHADALNATNIEDARKAKPNTKLTFGMVMSGLGNMLASAVSPGRIHCGGLLLLFGLTVVVLVSLDWLEVLPNNLDDLGEGVFEMIFLVSWFAVATLFWATGYVASSRSGAPFSFFIVTNRRIIFVTGTCFLGIFTEHLWRMKRITFLNTESALKSDRIGSVPAYVIADNVFTGDTKTNLLKLAYANPLLESWIGISDAK